jgi:hypothetical protein
MAGVTDSGRIALIILCLRHRFLAKRFSTRELFVDSMQNMPKTMAIIHIARKLLNRIRYVLKNQKEYVLAVIQ